MAAGADGRRLPHLCEAGILGRQQWTHQPQGCAAPPPPVLAWNLCLFDIDKKADPVRPATFWINPYGVHFGVLKVSDMVHIDEEGNRIGGADKPVNTAGFMIHSALHSRRPDINAACHMHSPYGRAWSTFGRPIDMLNQGTPSHAKTSWQNISLTQSARFLHVLQGPCSISFLWWRSPR